MLALLLSAALFPDQTQPSAITPNVVERMIDRYGAKQTVATLAEEDRNDTRTEFGRYDLVLDGVSSGDPGWLALVPRIEPGTDAATALSLRIAIAEALPKNPAGVLRLISRQPVWHVACSYPMIEPTEEETRTYFMAAIPALKAVRDRALQRAKKVCLTKLSHARHAP